ncbi:hypothetical protein L1276_002590 [Flavobacterium sp. HSC-32F16]|uniref:hypothetical protein n=1 Tax=Flavobacterium sp. HSC-32F16 TaxID=2910964 RepID=UPI0020A4603D|nr:hypothetical protein [Flavobacterium sp. HSC-32F16]MCP2027433.1 hypothetical protein [Flavobacterium sp. HSC-32F16]
MPRKVINPKNEAEILVKSRRRCALCFALENNNKVRKGQIAHVDRNNENAAFDNLVFLCFEHHDEYDSRPSQSKGIKPTELKVYREKLYKYFEDRNISDSPYSEILNEDASSFTIYKIINPDSELGYDWTALNSSRDTFISLGIDYFGIENFGSRHAKWLNCDYMETPSLTFKFDVVAFKEIITRIFFEKHFDTLVFQDTNKIINSIILRFHNPEGMYEIDYKISENTLTKNVGGYGYEYEVDDHSCIEVSLFSNFKVLLEDVHKSINFIKNYDAP